MIMLLFAVYLVTVLLIASKLCDVLSTRKNIRIHADETNSFVRRIMARYGTDKAVWLVFSIAVVIIGLACYQASRGGIVFQVLFIVVGTAISVVQGAVAHDNWTGQGNGISHRVRRLHSVLSNRN